MLVVYLNLMFADRVDILGSHKMRLSQQDDVQGALQPLPSDGWMVCHSAVRLSVLLISERV